MIVFPEWGIIRPMDSASDSLQKGAMTATLHEAGVAVMRENIKRRHPGFSPEDVDESLRRWLFRLDGPLPIDAAGFLTIRKLSS